MQLGIVVLHFNPTCFEATGVVQPCLVPQMTPFTSSKLSMCDHSLSCSSIDQHHYGPCPPSYCQEGSITEVINEGSCGGHQLENERRGRFWHSFGGL
ncbi:hypothetical protein ANAPC3_01364 [Anaplasma phagocytophilum]|nr:hypothetical protein ANAPC3_01364 [Anaplasma phagocytophilum]